VEIARRAANTITENRMQMKRFRSELRLYSKIMGRKRRTTTASVTMRRENRSTRVGELSWVYVSRVYVRVDFRRKLALSKCLQVFEFSGMGGLPWMRRSDAEYQLQSGSCFKREEKGLQTREMNRRNIT
jgi:hypothetical protein